MILPLEWPGKKRVWPPSRSKKDGRIQSPMMALQSSTSMEEAHETFGRP